MSTTVKCGACAYICCGGYLGAMYMKEPGIAVLLLIMAMCFTVFWSFGEDER